MQEVERHFEAETVIIGGGMAGVVAALELLDAGHSVTLLEAGDARSLGGQANAALGGMLLTGTREQHRNGVRDDETLLEEDWLRAAEFKPDDHWGPAWAHHYAASCTRDIYQWLVDKGVHFSPRVQWVERGNEGNGNSVPRYHLSSGCGEGVIKGLITRMLHHPRRELLTVHYRHRVAAFEQCNGRVVGCHGESPAGPFSIRADHVLVCCGGINGDLDRVRAHWDHVYGPPPPNLLAGSPPHANGRLHDQVKNMGGQVTNLHQMWNEATGIAHPRPVFPGQGLSLIPPRSALWLDANGHRIGPRPLVSGFDNHELCQRIGHLPGQYSWQLMNWKIAIKELAISGSTWNAHIRDHHFSRTLTGNRRLVRWMVNECPDVLSAATLEELVPLMNDLAGEDRVSLETLKADVHHYDRMIEQGPAFHNDDQLRRLKQLRQWRGDRRRTCNQVPILQPDAGPLIAIRERLISRRSMGGMQTDLSSRVLSPAGEPVPGLYAAGEAAGFGGGGLCGQRSLEGTFLTGCVLTARRAAQAIAS